MVHLAMRGLMEGSREKESDCTDVDGQVTAEYFNKDGDGGGRSGSCNGGYYCASLLFIIPELPRAVLERPKHSVRS